MYDRPRNAFVAGFIGSPEMNQHEVDFADGCLRWGDATLALEPSQAALTGNCSRVILGVRPEHLALQRNADNDVVLQATLRFVEHMGAEVFVHTDVGGLAFTARIPSDRLTGQQHAAKGTALSFFVNTAHTHLFAASNGLVLRA